MNRRINVQEGFATCVQDIGGILLDDTIVGSSAPKHADYWFPKHRVVGELKCLTEDLESSLQYQQRNSKLYASWIRRGLVKGSSNQRLTLNVAELPTECAREFLDPIKRRLESNVLRKANSQIKATQQMHDYSSSKGLLILINDGDYALPPEMMCHLLARATNQSYSAIDSVIYFSANEFVSAPGVAKESLFWIDAKLPNRSGVDLTLRESLRESWFRQHSKLLPQQPIFEINPQVRGVQMGDLQFSVRRKR